MSVASYFGLNDRPFIRTMWKLAIPMMLQQAVQSSITLLDNVMVGVLGDNALAALYQANQVSFLMYVFMFGITSGAQAFTAQFWGKRDLASIRKTQGLALIGGQIIGWSFFAICFFSPQTILRLFTQDAEVLALGAEYLSTVCFIYPMQGVTYVYAAILRGTENVKLPMMTAVAGMACNAVLNYGLILGNLGMPALGVRGAAFATVSSLVVDLTLILTLSHVWKKPTADRRYPLLGFDRYFVKRFFKIAIPVFLNESLWSMAQFTVALCYSHLGTQMTAAMSIFSVFDKMGFVLYVGLGNACAVLCGKRIGAGEEEIAQLYARRCLRLSFVVGAVACIVVNLAVPLLFPIYEASAAAKAIARNNVWIYGFASPILVHNFVLVIGLLRSGGDVRFSLMLDAGMQWCSMVAGVALAAYVLGVPPQWVYAFTVPGEVVKMVIGRRRIKNGKWIHHLTA